MRNYIKTLTIILLIITTATYIKYSTAIANNIGGKKVVHIDSYHYDYPWSRDIDNAVISILEKHRVNLKTFHMDTKRNTSEEFKKQAALKAKKLIEEFKPDLIIATDDNAVKYLVEPYFKDRDIPIVFAGIQWDASRYDIKRRHITGMIEVQSAEELFDFATTLAPKSNIVTLASDTYSARQDIHYFKEYFGIELLEENYAKNFAEWKGMFKASQDKDAIIYLGNIYGINDFDREEAKKFILKNTKTTTCGSLDFLKPYVAVTYARIAAEQGEWAAETAVKILSGTPPANISITKNKRGILYINKKITDKINITVPKHILSIANIIE